MIKVIDFKLLFRIVAIVTTLISIVTYEIIRKIWMPDLPLFRVVFFSTWGAMIVIFLITTDCTGRFLWRLLKKTSPSLFPDINGTWEGEIITETELKIPAKAVIRQSLLRTQVDIHTPTSKSLTLETTPANESGQPKLYYAYRSIPKDPKRNIYTGFTVFDVIHKDGGIELSGSYFTDRKTIGRILLKQTGTDIAADVSYY